MLSLQLKTGEYMTIGENVVVQLDHISGDRCKLMVQAPRDLTILRGEVRERSGGQRPACVLNGQHRHRQQISWNRSKSQTLMAMRRLLWQMDSGDKDVETLRQQLDLLFPTGFASNETVCSPE